MNDAHKISKDPTSAAQSKGLAIGGLRTANCVLLAPMSGVTDLPFRRIAARFGAGLVVSEMVASEALVDGDPETTLRMEGAGIRPHVVQLAGREARWMAEGARRAEASGAEMIDINMGCPSKRVTTGYSGSALMRDLDHAMTLIDATVGATALPVTVKMRLGWDERSINAPELARRAQDAGVQMITVHGRTRCQFYKGAANWPAIRAVSEAVSIPVIANGDCMDSRDAGRMLAQSGADGVMIGRGAYGRPWIVGAVADSLDGRPEREGPSGADLADLVVEHYQAMLAHYGTQLGLRCARKHLGWYLDGVAEDAKPAPAHRKALLTCDEPATVERLAHSLFSDCTSRRAA
ncbi:tRNA dihydrouridine synthase DusB [Breoghania sp. L-A4]|uniref:tRNA dihydrouridine synthase DusB n=1 Tax=Breoghania sp. L-A4 TaxID=2304600 RepID=UPI002110DC3C|nr:tRNA dihydrouridine synthase DusB [Breoghania sp. L-A4]